MLPSAAANWMTPSVSNAQGNAYTRDRGNPMAERLTLSGQAQQWATPRTITGGGESAHRKKELGRENSGGGDLQAQAQEWNLPFEEMQTKQIASPLWPTPDASSEKYRLSGNSQQSKSLEPLSRAFSLRAQATRDGSTSSPSIRTSTRRLNPIFGEWLMGWRLQWTNAVPSACGASVTASWRSRLQSHLSFLLCELEGGHE